MFFYKFIFFTLITVLSSCNNPNDKKQQAIERDKRYSKTQSHLFEILDNYKVDYSTAKQEGLKDEIQRKYLKKLENLLVDSLGRYIDSMTVVVDTVIQNGWMVTTQFHTRDIEFKYGMRFKDSMDSKNDSLYKFMRELKPNSEVTVNFIHLGAGELNKPDDKNVKTIRIFAYPVPLNFK